MTGLFFRHLLKKRTFGHWMEPLTPSEHVSDETQRRARAAFARADQTVVSMPDGGEQLTIDDCSLSASLTG